jgi:hypothetical protein
MRMTVVTAPACHLCDDAQRVLMELAQVYRLVAADTSEGQGCFPPTGPACSPWCWWIGRSSGCTAYLIDTTGAVSRA